MEKFTDIFNKIFFRKIIMIEKLNWDSDFFGIKIGRFVINNEIDFDEIKFKEEANDEKFELIYVFKLQEMLSWDTVIKTDLQLVDIMILMSKKFKKENFVQNNYKLRTELTEPELIECYYIAETIAKASRFYKESMIGELKTKALYKKWIDNTLNKSFADGLFIVKDSNSIIGIDLIKTDNKNKTGYCSLIGVNPNYKGRGIGKDLWEQSFGYWANEKEIESCKVSFSFQNSESFNFHLKIGFNKIEEIKYIYHFRNNIG